MAQRWRGRMVNGELQLSFGSNADVSV